MSCLEEARSPEDAPTPDISLFRSESPQERVGLVFWAAEWVVGSMTIRTRLSARLRCHGATTPVSRPAPLGSPAAPAGPLSGVPAARDKTAERCNQPRPPSGVTKRVTVQFHWRANLSSSAIHPFIFSGSLTMWAVEVRADHEPGTCSQRGRSGPGRPAVTPGAGAGPELAPGRVRAGDRLGREAESWLGSRCHVSAAATFRAVEHSWRAAGRRTAQG